MRGVHSIFWVLILFSGCASVPPPNLWSKVTRPALGPPQSIGSYSLGCVMGAQAMPPDGLGYQLMRLSRHRYYGHPSLIQFLKNFSKEIHSEDLGVLLIGDLGQPQGGPLLSGHVSHQTGLDVDIWFWMPEELETRFLSMDEREDWSAKSVVDQPRQDLARGGWTDDHEDVLKIAISYAEVNRIFVNPVIKRALCRKYSKHPKKASWLTKLRPWFGHDDHFHVRLNCPLESLACLAQDPLPPGNGCDETLDSWFLPKIPPDDSLKAKQDKKAQPKPQMPAQCTELIKTFKDGSS